MKQTLSQRKFKAGYVLKKEKDLDYGDFVITSAYTLNDEYIGDSKTAHFLIVKKGIKPELVPEHKVCSIGFCEKEQKWYGWSHRAICGFGLGAVVKKGDCTNTSGWTEDYLADHPEADVSLPVGFKAKTFADAKRMAIAFAESVG